MLPCEIWLFYVKRIYVRMEIRPKMVPPFKVTGTDTDRSATYDLL